MPSSLAPSSAPDPCLLIIFGASGDLTHRKLIPALYELQTRGELPRELAVLGLSRTPMSDDDFRAKMRESTKKFATSFDDRVWSAFAPRLHYHAADAAKLGDFAAIGERINQLAESHRLRKSAGPPNLLFYLSVSPNLYEPIIGNIGASGLVAEGKRWCSINPADTPWQRIIVEKPFGTDLRSAVSLNQSLGRVFEEDAIYRIDHYLGKELVQNILVLRFANSIFEPVWSREFIDHVQVTAAETIGVGARAGTFYDAGGGGAMRDMIQSHLLQVLSLVAIEPPTVFDAASSMHERIKFFNSAVITPVEKVPDIAFYGRYGPAPAKDGKPDDPGYTEEPGVDPARKTETYAAMRVEFDNWRWSGVPFYLRSGKKLAKKLTEIVIQFKRPPTNMFRLVGDDLDKLPANRLNIYIAPSEGLSVLVQGKVPGGGGGGIKIAPADLDLDYKERFGGEPVEAYGPLLLDCMRGDRALFKHREEVEGVWRICQPLLDSSNLRDRIETYTPGSWGPPGADALLAREGRAWHNPD